MTKEEKVRQYLELSGYSDEQINNNISNERYVDMIYGLITEYEEGFLNIGLNIDPVDNYANLDHRKIK